MKLLDANPMRGQKWFRVLMFLILSNVVYSDEILRDAVHFKDGAVLRGFVTEQVPNGSLKMKTATGLAEYQMADVESITKETIHVESERSPILSCIASLIPGLGQHINGEHLKGFIVEGAAVGGWLLTLTNKNGSPGAGEAGAVVYSAAMIFGLIDAPISASEKNAQRKREMFAGATEQNLNVGFRIGMNGQKRDLLTPGFEVALRF